MTLPQKITTARKKKGLTQEELADKANVTVRTIQRIEAGETIPRSFTLKAIAAALDIPFDELVTEETVPESKIDVSLNEDRHFLIMLCLSCFCYLVIPLVHFLVPHYLLRKRTGKNALVLELGRGVVRTQVLWAICTQLSLLLTLAYNMVRAVYFNKQYLVHYLWVFFAMYLINVFLILNSIRKIKAKIAA